MNLTRTFDPYDKWLSIPPEEQPPNHYRLLALRLFETDADVIDSAVQQRMGYLRSFQTGPNSELAGRLLNEVSAARDCLLDGESQAIYDTQLRAAQETISEEDSMALIMEEVEEISPIAATRSRSRIGKPFWKTFWAIPAAVGGVVVLLLTIVISIGSGEDSNVPGEDQINVLLGGLSNAKSTVSEEKVATKTIEKPMRTDAPKETWKKLNDSIWLRPNEFLNVLEKYSYHANPWKIIGFSNDSRFIYRLGPQRAGQNAMINRYGWIGWKRLYIHDVESRNLIGDVEIPIHRDEQNRVKIQPTSVEFSGDNSRLLVLYDLTPQRSTGKTKISKVFKINAQEVGLELEYLFNGEASFLSSERVLWVDKDLAIDTKSGTELINNAGKKLQYEGKVYPNVVLKRKDTGLIAGGKNGEDERLGSFPLIFRDDRRNWIANGRYEFLNVNTGEYHENNEFGVYAPVSVINKTYLKVERVIDGYAICEYALEFSVVKGTQSIKKKEVLILNSDEMKRLSYIEDPDLRKSFLRRIVVQHLDGLASGGEPRLSQMDRTTNGKWLIVGPYFGSSIWDPDSQTRIARLTDPTRKLSPPETNTRIALSPNGKYAATLVGNSAIKNSSISIWNLDRLKPEKHLKLLYAKRVSNQELDNLTREFIGVEFSPDGKNLYCFDVKDRALKLNLETKQLSGSKKSPNVTAVDSLRMISFKEATGGVEVNELRKSNHSLGKVTRVEYSPDSKLLFVQYKPILRLEGIQGLTRVWDRETKRYTWVRQDKGKDEKIPVGISAASVSFRLRENPRASTGRTLPESIAIFDRENKERLYDLDFVANFSQNSFCISSDGKMLASVDGTYLKIWSLETN